MTGFFKADKRKTKTVTIKGEDFVMFEPSYNDRHCWFEYHRVMMIGMDDKKDSNFVLAKGNNDSDCFMVAICLVDHFKETTVNEIRRLIAKYVTDEDDMFELVEEAQKLLNLKIEITELPPKTSDGA